MLVRVSRPEQRRQVSRKTVEQVQLVNALCLFAELARMSSG
jgi:hypothetical protein